MCDRCRELEDSWGDEPSGAPLGPARGEVDECPFFHGG